MRQQQEGFRSQGLGARLPTPAPQASLHTPSGSSEKCEEEERFLQLGLIIMESTDVAAGEFITRVLKTLGSIPGTTPRLNKVISCQWTMQNADQSKLKRSSGTIRNQTAVVLVGADIIFQVDLGLNMLSIQVTCPTGSKNVSK